METQYSTAVDVTDVRPSRAETWAALADLMAHGYLPAPREIGFSDTVGFEKHLSVWFTTTDDLAAWCEHMNVTMYQRDERYLNTIQSAADCARWRGWDLFMKVCIRVGDPTPAQVAAAALTPDAEVEDWDNPKPDSSADYHRRFPTWSDAHGHFICNDDDCKGRCNLPYDTAPDAEVAR